MPFAMKKDLQNATQNNCKALITIKVAVSYLQDFPRRPHPAWCPARHGQASDRKTGNLAAVRRQPDHTNAIYSMQYTRISDEELGNASEDR